MGDPYKKDCNIRGSILGSPILGKPSYGGLKVAMQDFRV